MYAHGSWVELSRGALENNVRQFRRLAGPNRALMAVVKSHAYGHGMVEISRLALEAGMNWLGVFSIHEALELRRAGLDAPVLVLGPTPPEAYPEAASLGIRPTLGSVEALRVLVDAPVEGLKIHLKLETGTNRQGFQEFQLDELKRLVGLPGVTVEGAYTHYADIEDTTDHRYAAQQLARFNEWLRRLAEIGLEPAVPHTACTAAALLFPQTHFAMMRVGIGLYGMWPSKETRVSAMQLGCEEISLEPVMTWKARVAQVKAIDPGEYVSYGRSFRAGRPTHLAVLPIGYANGFDRGLSNNAYVLINGRRAPIAGRICMNMCMADVTDIPTAKAGDEVVLLGAQGEECISAETMASWVGTINYELVTRAEPLGPRVIVE